MRATVFRGAVAIVTGGASGFGRGLAAELARRGARVVVADVDLAGARETAEATAVCPGLITSRVFENALYTDVRKDELLALTPFKFLSADDAAKRALDGIAKNRAVVVFPWYARLISVLWRLAPAIVEPLLLKSLRDVRRTRVRPGQ